MQHLCRSQQKRTGAREDAPLVLTEANDRQERVLGDFEGKEDGTETQSALGVLLRMNCALGHGGLGEA